MKHKNNKILYKMTESSFIAFQDNKNGYTYVIEEMEIAKKCEPHIMFNEMKETKNILINGGAE